MNYYCTPIITISILLTSFTVKEAPQIRGLPASYLFGAQIFGAQIDMLKWIFHYVMSNFSRQKLNICSKNEFVTQFFNCMSIAQHDHWSYLFEYEAKRWLREAVNLLLQGFIGQRASRSDPRCGSSTSGYI